MGQTICCEFRSRSSDKCENAHKHHKAATESSNSQGLRKPPASGGEASWRMEGDSRSSPILGAAQRDKERKAQGQHSLSGRAGTEGAGTEGLRDKGGEQGSVTEGLFQKDAA